jgi:hypothetical protein
MAIAAPVIAIAALAVPFTIEFLKRPRLTIEPSPWLPQTTFPFTFASVEVRNKPLPRPFNWVQSRDVAQACEASIDYYKLDSKEKLFDTVQGRWDSHEQPLAEIIAPPEPDDPDRLKVIGVYDPSRVSRQENIAVGNDRAQISVALLTNKGHAFAFGDESYAHLPMFDKPDWKLPEGAYRIVIRVRASNLPKVHEQAFKLEYHGPDFSKFQLQSLT